MARLSRITVPDFPHDETEPAAGSALRFPVGDEPRPDQAGIYADMIRIAQLFVRIFHIPRALPCVPRANRFPFPATGYIAKDGARYQLAPMSWQPVL